MDGVDSLVELEELRLYDNNLTDVASLRALTKLTLLHVITESIGKTVQTLSAVGQQSTNNCGRHRIIGEA